MTWSEIVALFKRLDSQLSDAAYFHGRCLVGQENPRRHVHEHAVDNNLRKPPSAGSIRTPVVMRSDAARHLSSNCNESPRQDGNKWGVYDHKPIFRKYS